MGTHNETAIFRRFGELNMLNLLSLQAELTDLEIELQNIRDADEVAEDPARNLYAIDFHEMRKRGDERDDQQWQMLLRIREKLQEYSITRSQTIPKNIRKLTRNSKDAALLQAAQISQLEAPRESELTFLRDWLQRPTMGNSFLRGREDSIWKGHAPQEMVTLAQRQMEQDPFSNWLSTRLVDIYDKIWGNRRKTPITEDPDSGIVEYEDTRLTAISNAVGVIFASLVPTISVLVLYFIQNMLVRIGLLVVFTAVFAAALAVFTKARKIEIFSAIAA